MGAKSYLQFVLYFHVLAILGYVGAAEIRHEYNIHLNESYQSCTLLSPGYPNNPSADTEISWDLVGPKDRRLELHCSDIALPSRGVCTEGVLYIYPGSRNPVLLCGQTSSYRRQSVRNIMNVCLNTYRNHLGRLNCTVRLLSPGEKTGEPGLPQTTCPCGRRNENRILDEEEPKVEELTFVAYLRKRGTKGSFCDGSVLTKRHILTAAGCVSKEQPQDIEVVLGSHKLLTDTTDNRVQIAKVQKTYSHEKYKDNRTNDIALVELTEDIDFNEFVGPICLPTEVYYTTQPRTALGWCDEEMWGKEGARHWIILFGGDKELLKNLTSKQDRHDVCKNQPVLREPGGPVVIWDPKLRRYVQWQLTSREKNFTLINIRLYFKWIETIISQHSPPCNTCEKLEKLD